MRADEAERANLSRELVEAERAATSQRSRVEFLKSPQGLASSSDRELRQGAGKHVELEKQQTAAQATLSDFDRANGDLHQHGVALRESRKQLDRRIPEWQWKQDWLQLLPKLEENHIELARLQSLGWREELSIPGVMPTVPGIPLDLKPDGRATEPEDIRKVIAFQAGLFGDDVPAMAQGGVIPSSLRIGW